MSSQCMTSMRMAPISKADLRLRFTWRDIRKAKGTKKWPKHDHDAKRALPFLDGA